MDVGRAVATVFIVVTHVVTGILYSHGEASRADWWMANLAGSVSRICVPVFFMLTGHLLLRSQDTLPVFLGKRVKKVLIPLLVWTVVFLAWNRYVEPRTDLGSHPLVGLLIHPAYYHLWFLYAILGIYLVVPLLRIVVAAASPTMLGYYVLLWFLAVALLPMVERFSGVRNNVDLLAVSGHIGYLVIGYVLGTLRVTRTQAWLAAALFIAGVAMTMAGTAWMTSRSGSFNEAFYSYKSANVIVASCAFVVMLRHLDETGHLWRHPWVMGLSRALSSASLGIYLVHPIPLYLVRSAFANQGLDGKSGDAIWTIPLVMIVVVVLSYGVTLALQRVPVMRNAVP